MPRDYTSSPPRILLVEDDADLASNLETCFRSEGYNVTTVQNGKNALEKAINQSFDVITTDLQMPDCDGVTFIQNLRKSPQKHAKVVVISGYLSKERVTKLVDLNIHKIYAKPFNSDDLLQSVNKLIEYDSSRIRSPKALVQEAPKETAEDEVEIT